MALWGKTDDLAGTPKFIARTATVAAAKINTTADTINILESGTGFATGDAVVYTGNATGPTSGSTYYIRVVDAGVVELYDTYARSIDAPTTTGRVNFTNAGSSTHSLQRTGAANVFGDHVNNGRAIVFVDQQEAQVDANKAKGITGAGWWLYRTYTDGQSATRHKAECLVAMTVDVATSSDAEDTIVGDLVITIGTQPDDVTVTEPATATFTVAATINGVVPLSYQWQIQQSGAGAWANIAGATSTTYTTGATAVSAGAGATNGDKFRVVITGGGVTATSDAATLTVEAEEG